MKNRADYEFAKTKFEVLWENAVDVKDKYIETIREKTWLNDTITPYELYLKFLYEYFKDDLYQTDEVTSRYLPEEFKRLEYQEQAVLNAKKILDEYGGVFISDVVGLGKTYVSAMLRAGSTVERLSWPHPCSWIRRTPARGPMSFQISGYLLILSRWASWIISLVAARKNTTTSSSTKRTATERNQTSPTKKSLRSAGAKESYW